MDDQIYDDRHYNERYLTRERWLSYVYQIHALEDVAPTSILEVGRGAGAVAEMTRLNFPRCRLVTIDIEPALKPDVVGSVTALPFADKSFDAAFCCQVLEHLPFEQFGVALGELARVARRRLVLSLPDVSPFFYMRIHGLRRMTPVLWRGITLPSLAPRPHDFASHGQHYWEIGKKGYPTRRVVAEIEKAGFRVERRFRMVERNYWHFFILEPKR